jgi:hypothetical protein
MSPRHTASRPTLRTAAAIGVGLALLSAACSTNGDKTVAVPSASSSSPVSPSPSLTPSPAPTFSPAAHWAFRLVGDNGDTTDGSLDAGRFATIDKAAPLPSGQTATGLPCTVDSERDVVAPAVLSLTNANASLSQKLYMSLYAVDDRSPQSDDAILNAAAFYSAGPQCTSITRWTYSQGQSALQLGSVDPVPPGNNVTVEVYLVLHNFITPQAPEGDESLLRNIGLVVYLGGGSEHGPRQVTRLSGPKGGKYSGWPRLPLAPLAPSNTTIAKSIARVPGMRCDSSYVLRATGARRILIETVGSGATGKFQVVALSGRVVTSFETVWGERRSYNFVMPATGQVTIRGLTGDNFVTACRADLSFLYAG